MHRSGTSIAARLVQLLGVSLGDPDDLLAPGRDNPAGYWENRTIKELDDELLAHCGGSWDQPPVLAPGWEHDAGLDPFRARAAEALAASFAGTSGDAAIGWKDPRLSLLLPFWRTVTPVTTTVVVVRDPTEVAESLRTRNAIDPAQAALLWLRYLYAATAADPTHLLVRLDDFFDDLGGSLATMADHLGFPAPDDALVDRARAHVDPGLRHHSNLTGSPSRARAPAPAVGGAAAPAGDPNPVVALAREVWAEGAMRLDAVPPLVADALAQGWLRPPIDAEALARARAQVVTLRETVRRRKAQRARKEARDRAREEGAS
jgi:hypothetical protein